MQTRPLGESGIDASVVGLGAWAIGGWMWGGTDEQDAVHAVHAALDHGVNLIDTAPIYGLGLSEQIIGRAIRDRRDDVVLATKCGMVTNTTNGEHKINSTILGVSETGHLGIYIYLHPESIRHELEKSLLRLGVDHIDLYQTHWQESTTPITDTMGELMRLREEGKIRAIGVCNATTQRMDEYRAAGRLDADQERYSMLDRELEAGQLPYCREHNIAVLAYSPLALGLLTGKVGPERQFEPGDLRHDNPRFSEANRRRVQDMLAMMQPVADRHGVTISQLVIAWTFHQPGLTHVLCGARNRRQAEENAAAGRVSLTDEDLRDINAAIDEYTAPVTA